MKGTHEFYVLALQLFLSFFLFFRGGQGERERIKSRLHAKPRAGGGPLSNSPEIMTSAEI